MATHRPRKLSAVPDARVLWRNPCAESEPCEVIECFEEGGCTYYLIVFADGEEMVVPSDELDLDCRGAGGVEAAIRAEPAERAEAA